MTKNPPGTIFLLSTVTPIEKTVNTFLALLQQLRINYLGSLHENNANPCETWPYEALNSPLKGPT